MVILQRLTSQLTSKRCFSMLNSLFKASSQSQLSFSSSLCQSFKSVESLRVCGCLRFKSDTPSDGSSSGQEKPTNANGDDDRSTELESKEKESSSPDELVPSMSSKYKLFEKSEEELILDYREELLSQDSATDWPSDGINFLFRENQSKFDSINLERGVKEVIDIEELVTLLKQENINDIVVLSVPPVMRYADYMLIASAKSSKHLEAVTAFLLKVWKLKKHRADPFLQVEGEDSTDWKTIDMGSIVVHLFLPDTREKYDLESLWLLGYEFDDLTQKPVVNPGLDLLEKHLEYLKSQKPVDPPIRKAEMVPIFVKPGTTKKQIKEMQAALLKAKTKSSTEPRETINEER